MKITLTQAQPGVAIGATASLHVDLAMAGAPPMDSAALLGVTDGAFREVTLGLGLELVDGVLQSAGGGSGYTLIPATSKALGGVIVGSTLTVSKDGTLSLSSGNVTTALGFTPVDAASAAAAAPVQSVAGRTGVVTLGTADISGFTAAAAAAAPVQSVAGRTGVVTLGTADISGFTAAAAAAAPVQSVAGRTGAVVLAAGDIASGTLAAARLPLATGAAVGGVQVGSNITVTTGTISLTGGNVTAALGLTPVDAAGAAAAAPVQSVGGSKGAVTLPYGMTVDFSQGAVPASGTITLDGGLSGGTTITDVVHGIGSAGGSMTWQLQIVSGGVPTAITGLSAITTSKSTMTTTTATAANKGVAGDQLQLVISGVTGTPAGASLTIRGTKP